MVYGKGSWDGYPHSRAKQAGSLDVDNNKDITTSTKFTSCLMVQKVRARAIPRNKPRDRRLRLPRASNHPVAFFASYYTNRARQVHIF